MSEILNSTLWITLIGMGLVFVAILLLWALMEIVVRATARSGAQAETKEVESAPEADPSPAQVDQRKTRAAAAAVAYALSARKGSKASFTPPPAGSGSAWQAVMRSIQINTRGQLSARKSRGK